MSIETDILKRAGYTGKEAFEMTRTEHRDYETSTDPGTLFPITNDEIEEILRKPDTKTHIPRAKTPEKVQGKTEQQKVELVVEEKTKQTPVSIPPAPRIPIIESPKIDIIQTRGNMKETRENYILKIKGNTQNFVSRLRMEEEKGAENFAFWRDVVAKLVCLSLVVSKQFNKLTLEELREFNAMFSVAAIIHDDKNDLQERKRAVEGLKHLVDQSIPRYAYLLDLTEEEVLTRMEQEKAIFSKSHTAIVKQEGGLIIDRTLKLRQSTKEPAKMVPRGKIISIEDRVSEETPIEYTRRRMQEESTLKKHLAYLLKTSYENIKEFEAKYKKYSDFRHNVQDISRTINPIIRNEKVRKMQEHLFKLERYHRTISSLYNTLYNIIIYQYDELSRDELIQVESLFLLYQSMTISLKDSIGDYSVTTMERRRLRLQEQITKYNGYIDQIITERENGNPSYVGEIIPYGGNQGPKKA